MTPAAIAFLLVTGFGNPDSFITVPGLADENSCHALALKMNAIKHLCFEHRMAAPHTDVADAVQDELQDSGIIRRSAKSIRSSLNRSVATPAPFRIP